MKPKRHQRHLGPNLQGKNVHKSEKTSVSQTKQKLRVSSALATPFAGKVFYLDLPSNKTTQSLEKDIQELGGTVEKFFSKEIRYLVSNKWEARYANSLGQDSPVPSPVSGQSSPHPRANSLCAGNRKNMSPDQTNARVISRGKTLVERVVKEQRKIQMDGILSNALEWGVKIFYIDDVMAEVKKKKIARCQVSKSLIPKSSIKTQTATKQDFLTDKGGPIKKPFIKVEDYTLHYRPLLLTMPNMPAFNLRNGPPFSPFYLEDKNPGEAKQREPRHMKASTEERAPVRKKNKKSNGFCECCMVKYNKLRMHLQSERHRAFSQSNEYDVVDKIISNLPYNFTTINTEDDQRRMEDHKWSKLVKVENECEGTCSGSKIRTRLAFNTDLEFKAKRCERKSLTQLDKCGTKPRVCKAAQHLKTLTRKQKAERAQTETMPSGGNCLPVVTPTDTKVKVVEQIILEDVNWSNARKTKAKCIKTFLTSPTHSHDVTWKNMLQCNVLEENAFTEKQPQTEDVNSSSQSFSPVRKIQRKIRAYKRRKRKIDTDIEPVHPNTPEKTSRTLWDLFLSSDDVNGEFNGFES